MSYRTALWLHCTGLAIFLASFILLMALTDKRIGFAGTAFGVALTIFARQFRCPQCGKSMMVGYFGLKPANPLRFVLARNNYLPERTCSDCGTRLDGSAAEDKAAA